MRTTRAFDLANRLAATAGTRVRVRPRRGGGYRLELTLRQRPDPEAHRRILALLAESDRYGHHNSSAAQRIWAEIDEEPGH